MSEKAGATIAFDVLLRGETDDFSAAQTSLDKLRPPAVAIERCFGWLSDQGVICHRTDFGLACEARVDLFESLFSVQVATVQATPTSPPSYKLQDQPRPPPEIEPLIMQVTLAQPPTYFD